MTKQEIDKLRRYFEAGYMVLIEDGPYLDSPVQSIHESEEVDPLDPARTTDVMVYTSEVYKDRPLSEVPSGDVKAYKPVDWQLTNEEPEDNVRIE